MCSRPGSFAKMSGTVAPGKQRLTALKKLMFLVMESLIIRIVRGNRGRGDVVCGLSGLDDGGVDGVNSGMERRLLEWEDC